MKMKTPKITPSMSTISNIKKHYQIALNYCILPSAPVISSTNFTIQRIRYSTFHCIVTKLSSYIPTYLPLKNCHSRSLLMNSPPLDHILSQPNPDHIIDPLFHKIHLYVNLPHTPSSSPWSLSAS